MSLANGPKLFISSCLVFMLWGDVLVFEMIPFIDFCLQHGIYKSFVFITINSELLFTFSKVVDDFCIFQLCDTGHLYMISCFIFHLDLFETHTKIATNMGFSLILKTNIWVNVNVWSEMAFKLYVKVFYLNGQIV